MDALADAIDARHIRHGDLPRWQEVLDALPTERQPGMYVQDGTVCVGSREDSGLREVFMQLCPWRKGPFNIAGVQIDTEWRSDWKWDRVLPALTSLHGRHVMDVGCGSGYHLWRMREAGAASVLGVEPMLLYQHQFDVVQHFAQDPGVQCLPLSLEDLPDELPRMDTVFSMGVLYHARDPHQHLRQLYRRLRPGGECLLETLVLDEPGQEDIDDSEISITDRYARMRNIQVLPSSSRVCRWLQEAGFENIRLVHRSRTTTTEQHRTPWMPFDSLQETLNPDDNTLTVEGLPAPCRAVLTGTRPTEQ